MDATTHEALPDATNTSGRGASLAFARWMARPEGRLLRIAAGLLLASASARARGTNRTLLRVAAAVPFLAGTFNVCLLARLLGVPFRGRAALDGGMR